MNRQRQHRSRSLMVGKYYVMLLGGTLSMAILSIVLISDSIISGIMLGSDAVVGVMLVSPICSLASFLGSLTSLGVPILYSAEMGQFHKRDADRVFGVGIALSTGMGTALFILTSLVGNAYLQMCRPSAVELEQAMCYLHRLRFSMLLLPLQMLMSGMVYADGDEIISTAASITQGFGNIAASLLLSRFMGIEGVALGSFLFYAISLGILATHFLKKNNSLRVRLYFSTKILKKIVRYSAIYSSEYLFEGLLILSLSAFVSVRFGTDFLILVSAVNLCRVVQVNFEGIGEAITPIVSVYLGENCFPGVQNIYAKAEKTTRWESIAITGGLLLFAPLTPAVLGITDPALAAMSIWGTRILALSSFLVGMLYLSTAYYMLLDKVLLGLLISALRDFLLAVPMAVLLGLWLGVYGFFAGLALTPLVTGLIVMSLLRMRYGEDAPLLLDQRRTGGEALLYDLIASPSSIVDTRDRIGRALEKRGYSVRTVNRTMLLFEEMFMLIREKNPGVEIQGECALLLEGDAVRMIVRDTGIQFDPSDADMKVSSLGSYVVSTVAEHISSRKQHLVTLSFNRNVFELKEP